MTRVLRKLAFGLVLTLVVGACDGTNTIGPENQLEVTNAADNFQFQVTALNKVTQTLSYTWQNSGPQATLDISQAITGGTALLTVSDPDGKVVYQEDIRSAVEGQTEIGVAGGWTIRVQLDDVTGTFNFRVQRTT